MRPVISSEKHYIQMAIQNVASGATTTVSLAQGVAILNKNLASEVREGAVVKAVYIEIWAGATSTDRTSIAIGFMKVPDLQTPTHTDIATLNNYTNKKNVFYFTQGLANETGASATPFLRTWLKVPKGKQRIGLGDTLFLTVSALAGEAEFCGFITYKEYF